MRWTLKEKTMIQMERMKKVKTSKKKMLMRPCSSNDHYNEATK
jgi:hypothetical protein